ncbi:MAG: prepilin-type N-terminal cleavage/methylation domain-containing protein [Candidatus Moraniibacteriota bacterium]
MEKRKLKSDFLRGFTLVEVMVVAAMIGIISAISLVSLSDSRVQGDVIAGERTLSAAIREAQAYALTGKNINGMCGTDSCIPCEFRFHANGGAYSITQSNIDSSGSCGPFSTPVDIPFLNGVVASDMTVIFLVPRAEPLDSFSNELVSGSMDFSLSKAGKVGHVCLYPLGRIEELPVGVSGC